MEILFSRLSAAMSGAPLVALIAAFAWGVLSVVLSPCHLASIPLIVGYLQGDGAVTPRRAAGLSTLFAAGILASIAGVGVATAAASRMLGDLGPWGNYAVAAVLGGFGLHLLGVVPLPPGWSPAAGPPRRGGAGALAFGLLFGLALGPCTFGFMAPVLALGFRAAATAPGYALAVVGLFGVGHCAVISLAGVSVTSVQRWLAWQEGTPAARWLRRGCGVLVCAGGFYQVVSAP